MKTATPLRADAVVLGLTDQVVLGPDAGATVSVYEVEGGWRWRWRAAGPGLPVEAVGGRALCASAEEALARGTAEVRAYAARIGLR